VREMASINSGLVGRSDEPMSGRSLDQRRGMHDRRRG